MPRKTRPNLSGTPPGRPEFEPTSSQREQVKTMVAFGIPVGDIATVVGISLPTLRKHFDAEIQTGAIIANTRVAQSLFQRATSADGGQSSVTAAIFWLKCRAGWNDGSAAVPGKKEQREIDAMTIGDGTAWEQLLN